MKQKSIRFTQLVAQAGQPEAVTLWTEPEADRDFMKAVRQRRVVTVVQENVGTRRDFGTVGFRKEPHASWFVFPRPLTAPEGAKVIGIKYDQLAESKLSGPEYKPRAVRPGIPMREKPRWQPQPEPELAKAKPRKAATAPATLDKFQAEIEMIAREKVRLEVTARNKSEALRLVRKQAAGRVPDLEKAAIVRRVSNLRKVD